MPIRPIEIMKSQEVSLIKQGIDQKTQQERNHISTQFGNHIKQDSEKTVKTSKSDNNEYSYDAKEKGNNSFADSKNEKKDKDEKEQDKASKNPIKPGNFDILI